MTARFFVIILFALLKVFSDEHVQSAPLTGMIGGLIGEAGALHVWTASSLEKITKNCVPADSVEIHLQAARNEFELAHIVVQANGANLTQVNIQQFELIGDRGIIAASNIRLYREDYLRVSQRSNVEGSAGFWPDPLIPKEDIFYHEKRNAFPFQVQSGDNQPVLVEVYVPGNTPAGMYRGSITVTAEGQVAVNIPVEMEVFDFALPSTSSLETSYSISTIGISRGFTQALHYDEPGIVALVMKDMLLHRISTRLVSWQSHAPYTQTASNLEVDWSHWDQYFGPFFEGRALDGLDVLPGARFTTWSLLVDTVAPAEEIAYADAQVEHFHKRNWPQFLYRQITDEPQKAQYPSVHEELQRWMQMKNRISLMVTTGDVAEFTGEITLWCEVMNFLHRYDDNTARGYRDTRFADRVAKGDHLWWYQSCMSTGCFIDGTSPIYTGWPSMAIDHQGIYQRIMPWITWKYDIEGELYYEIAVNWIAWDGKTGSINDPWLNFDYFHLNGDGRLIYPGTVDKIGGIHPVPVESLRLKLIRDGYEDYEYFVMMKKAGFDKELKTMIDKIVIRNNDWDKNPKVLLGLRSQMGRLISQCGAYVPERSK